MTDKPEVELFTYEWFKSLTDKELSDIALLEATWDHSHFDGSTMSSTQRDLLAALAHRVKHYEQT